MTKRRFPSHDRQRDKTKAPKRTTGVGSGTSNQVRNDDPDALWAQERYFEAIPGYEKRLAHVPSDNLRRKLAICYYNAALNPSRGAEIIASMERPNVWDLHLQGELLIAAQDWHTACEILGRAWEREQHPTIVGSLVEALQQSRPWSDLDEDTQQQIVSLRARGMMLPDAPPSMALAWFYEAKGDYRDLLRQLEEVWPLSSDPVPIRGHLAYHYLCGGHPDQASPHIDCLVESEQGPRTLILWMAARLACVRGNYVLAEQHLRECQAAAQRESVGIDWPRVWGDFRWRLGDVDAALAHYRSMTGESFGVDDRVHAWINVAWVYLQTSRRGDALEALQQAITIWRTDKRAVAVYDFTYFHMKAEIVEYPTPQLVDIIKLLGDPMPDTQDVYGALCLMDSSIDADHSVEALLRILTWVSPVDKSEVYRDLVNAYLSQEQWTKALAMIAASQTQTGRDYVAEDEGTVASRLERLPTDTATRRKAYHQTLWKELMGVADSTKSVVGLDRIYRLFWRDILAAQELWSEWATVAQTLRAHIEPEESGSLLWDEAFAQMNSGQWVVAGRLYEEWVGVYSDDWAAWHNLAVITEHLGDLEKASQYIERAFHLNPDSAVTGQVRDDFTRRVAEQQRREAILREAPDRWRALDHHKRTILVALSTMTSTSDFRWGELSDLSGVGVRYP